MVSESPLEGWAVAGKQESLRVNHIETWGLASALDLADRTISPAPDSQSFFVLAEEQGPVLSQ
ncbi:hypothetical protein D3C77_372140 [compost metagenome]